ncbi:MarR family winged helix-turn-helix transcriptional regulator [Oceanibacterium hippocampi]|uniref:HTH-type transcriptional repressor NicR n=1 Tax=Oceanibacterium hippocampi TaxID=745714 RepID=A0A1Y5RXW1_9PROT|nr:MarR family transcriptional regulator [Oceanibacterium hippocampi]SLN26929.1 HTH-type transcriptional repressor NicR [Oceanibacterium hippocampi]
MPYRARPVRIEHQDPVYVLEEQIGHLLRRAHQRATAVFQSTIGEDNLTPTQYAVLSKLYAHGELSQNHLGRLTAMDPATTMNLIRRLRARDLVATRRDPDDGRRVLLQLTDSGEDLFLRHYGNGFVVSERILEPLDAAEQATLLALLKKLI